MYIAILVVIIVICCALMFVIIIQNSKGGGLNSSIATANAASQILGARRGADVVEKATWWLVGVMALLTFAANIYLYSNQESGSAANTSKLKQAVEGQRLPSAPAAPAQKQQDQPKDGGKTE